MTWRELCERYISAHAQKAKAEEEIKKLQLVDKIKDGLNSGKVSPRDLPYCLVVRTSQRSEKDYRTPLLDAWKRLFGKDTAEAKMVGLEAGWPKTEVQSLHVTVNNEYAADVATVSR